MQNKFIIEDEQTQNWLFEKANKIDKFLVAWSRKTETAQITVSGMKMGLAGAILKMF